MRAFSDIAEYSVRSGTTSIDGLAFRKCSRLSSVTLPDGLLTIGDAAFSFCASLRQILVPASVERIGVAAFCQSGLVTIQFQGIPKEIEANAFEGCQQLKEIVVPIGSRDVFIRKFGLPEDKVIEGKGHVQVTKQAAESSPAPHSGNPFKMKAARSIHFSYNACYFNWTTGDVVDLRTVFSGPITLMGNLTYEFRRKALFVFMKSAAAKTLKPTATYELPADATTFARKYQDKYANRQPRILIFVCDDGKTARFFDEVWLVRININSITVKSGSRTN